MFLLAKVEDLAYYQDLAQARNPLLSQVSLKRELAQEGVRAQRADFLPQVAAIGGGTGLSTLLLGLKEYTDNITAIVTVTDDGGGSGVLRDEYGMLPPGDIRNCLLALANTSDAMNELLNYRFPTAPLKGQSFGNLFLLALNGVCGSFQTAVARMNDFFWPSPARCCR